MDIKTIGVAGLGLLGRGIAACLVGHGFRVVAFTRRETTHDEARAYIARAINDLVERAGFDSELLYEWTERYQPVSSLEPMAGSDFVIETVIEDVETKQGIFDQLESLVAAEVPIASNTSALPISQLQLGRKHPERFLGMHWAEPAHITRFMELIRGEHTSDVAFQTAAELAKAIGKEPCLVQKDVPAFIVNRIGYAMYREAVNILEMGVADVETIDRSARNALGLWATICGPFRWMDITGGPGLYAEAIRGVLPSLSNATELPKTLQDFMDSGAQGAADGNGFYKYTEEEAQKWEELFLKHAWNVRELVNEYFPLEDT
jgi:3-hydroxybutyryl-CoA dehydrogenase